MYFLLNQCWGLKIYNIKAQNSTVGEPHIKGLSSPQEKGMAQAH